MSIQRITSVSPLKPYMQQSSKKESPEKPEGQRNNAELLKSDALKSRFLSGVSFKGHSANVQCSASGDFKHPSETEIIKGEKPVNNNGYNSADEDVYFADIDEEITPEILKNHAAVLVYKKMPAQVSDEKIKGTKKISEMEAIIKDLELTGKLFEAQKELKQKELAKISDDLTKAQMILEKIQKEQILKAAEVNMLTESIMTVDDKLDLANLCLTNLHDNENQERMKNETLNALRIFVHNVNDSNTKDEAVLSLKKTAMEYIERNTRPQKTDN